MLAFAATQLHWCKQHNVLRRIKAMLSRSFFNARLDSCSRRDPCLAKSNASINCWPLYGPERGVDRVLAFDAGTCCTLCVRHTLSRSNSCSVRQWPGQKQLALSFGYQGVRRQIFFDWQEGVVFHRQESWVKCYAVQPSPMPMHLLIMIIS